jgi:K+-transporting ATPase A subunit
MRSLCSFYNCLANFEVTLTYTVLIINLVTHLTKRNHGIVGALTFIPALALGPLVEPLLMLA